tara:strand:+ start:68 stop:196 length:129 start_codon:yes stop_codon:yes gene_type:complete
MDIKTKTELLAMSNEEIKEKEMEAWNYYRKIQAVMNFKKLED